MKHLGPISGIASFGEDLVCTAGYDNQIILWDASSGKARARAYHDHLANQCAFSASGTYLVTASSDYSARIWTLPYLRLCSVLLGHEDDVEMAVFSPDETRVATCSRDRTVRIFARAGECLAVMRGHTDDVISVSWSVDGGSLISSSDDGTIRTWDAVSGRQVGIVDVGGVQTDTLAIAPDATIFAGDDLGRLAVLHDGQQIFIEAHAAGIKRLVYDYASSRLASLSYDRTLALWHVTEDKGLREILRSSLPSIVWPRAGTFLGSTRMVFGTFGSTFALFDSTSATWQTSHIEPDISLNAIAHVGDDVYTIGDAGILLRNGHLHSRIGSLCNFLLPFGDCLLTGGQLGLLFDAHSGLPIHQHKAPLNCGTTFTRNGLKHALIGTYTGEGLLFRTEANGRVEFVGELSMHDNAIKGVAANEDFIFSVCASGAAAFHRISDLSVVRQIERAHERIANGCVRIKDGFASIGRDLKLRVWRAEGNAEVFETPHSNSIKCIAANANGDVVVTGSYGGTIAAFSLADYRWTRVDRPTAAGISCVTYAGNDEYAFLASSYDGHVYPLST